MPAGRPTDCTSETTELAWTYIGLDDKTNYASHNHVVPSIVGLCRVLNIARSTLYEWSENTDTQFPDIFSEIKAAQLFELTNKGLAGDTNSVITKLMLTKHGYTDKTESKVDVNDYSSLEGDDLDRKIREMQQLLDKSKEE
jgi:hypothetical protein